SRLIDDLSIWDYHAQTTRTQGFSVFEDSVTTLRPDAENKPFHAICVPTDQFKSLDRMIPREASSFSIDTGCNIEALYDWMLALIKDSVPEGRSLLKEWSDFQKDHDFNLREDVLHIFEGTTIYVGIPGDSIGKDHWVWFFKVRDEKKATKQLRRLI